MSGVLTPGDVFAGAYRVLGNVGAGGMGLVYLVEELSTGARVALKLLHPVLAQDPKSVHRFEREARAGMSIDSPHVARVLATGDDAQTEQRWLAMEFAPGVDLGRYVRERTLSSGAAVAILEQLFAALSAAHRAGVVHRDLKPDNIVVDSAQADHPRLKVLDFGIAKSLSSATAISTSPGQGTPLWTAPEQMRMDDVPQPSADVWSLGLIAFFVLTGKLYWLHAQGRLSMMQLSMELSRNPIAPPTQRCQELGITTPLPREFDVWFLRCVHRDARSRYADAAAAYLGFQACLRASEGAESQLSGA